MMETGRDVCYCVAEILVFPLFAGVIPAIVEGYDLKAPDHVLVEEGLCAVIPCNFTYNKEHAKPNKKLIGFWKKGTENTDSIEVSQERFQLTGNLTAGNCSLLILNAQKIDSGNYFFRMEKKPKALFSFYSYADPYLNVTGEYLENSSAFVRSAGFHQPL